MAGMTDRIMEMTASAVSWQTRSISEQKRIALFVLFAAALLPVLVWLWTDSAIQKNLEEKEVIIQRYERAFPLASRVMADKSGQDQFSGLSPLAATQQVAREMNIEGRLVSVRPSRAIQGREGVQIHVQDLNLPELLYFFQSLRDQAELQIVSGNLNKRMDNPERMDLSLVLSR